MLVLLRPAALDAQTHLSFSTPLHWAAANGQTTLVGMLLDNGAPVNGADSWGRTPLHVAVRWPDVVKLLLERGAAVDVTDRFLNTPLHLGVRDRDVVTMLLEAGADPNAKNTFGRTPLDLCLRRGDSPHNMSVARLLVQAGAGTPTTATY